MEGKSVLKSDVSEYDEFLREKCPIENRLLKVRVRLDNGNQSQVFTMVPTEQGPRWRCHVCSATVFGSYNIFKHEKSKDHSAEMNRSDHQSYKFRSQSPPPKPKQTLLEMKLAPGEPVPPGFEGEVCEVTEIQSKLDKFDSPLIGLEYLVELLSSDDSNEPRYICILCDKRGDPRTVMNHLLSYHHRLKFLQTHFPKAYQKFREYAYCKDQRKQCSGLITELAEWIEKRFGRLAPHASEQASFEKNRRNYTKKIVSDVHFSEKSGETLEELIDGERFKNPEGLSNVSPMEGIESTSNVSEKRNILKKNRSPSPPVVSPPGIRKRSSAKEPLSPISSVSSSSLSDTPSRSRSRSRDRQRSRYRDTRDTRDLNTIKRTRSRNRTRSRSRSRFYRDRSLSPSPKRRYNKPSYPWTSSKYSYYCRPRSDFIIDNRQKLTLENLRWEQYRKGCAKIEEDLEHALNNHEKNPERHPQYPEEWKKFWNRRYKELQAEHKDPTKHDFKPEWIDYWNKRIKELHDIDLKTQKENLRKKLNLPDEPQPIKFKIGQKKPSMKLDNVSDQDLDNDDVIIIEDKDDDVKIKPVEKRERTRSRSPWEIEAPREQKKYSVPPKRDYYKPRSYQERPLSFYPPNKEEESEDNSSTELNIVAVLRLLTALEDKLGSLGPKVIDMLSTALAMEKAEANSAETLLDNDVHCVLFETVKEKLKGQLLAGMIDRYAEKPTKKAIKQIASLMHQASETKRKETENKEKVCLQKNKEQVVVPGIGEIDKAAIARQIANALVAQGRTDVTQEELEQLIAAVVGMAQESQGAGVTISAAEYASKLQVSTSVVSKSNENSLSPVTETNAMSALKMLHSAYNDQSTNAMEGLSDSDLKTLLQNFKDLSSDEQHALISYLKKLEATEPDRVSRLRMYVNSGPTQSKSENDVPEKVTPPTGRDSPFSNRQESMNPSEEKNSKATLIKIDSDEDDDYSYEDVFKAASKNLKDKQLAEERKLMESKSKNDDPNILLNDAKQMIANIMGQLGKKNSSPSLNLLGLTPLDHDSRTVSNISAETERPGSSLVMNNSNSNQYEGESASNNLMAMLSAATSISRQNAPARYDTPTGYTQENDPYGNFDSTMQPQKNLYDQQNYRQNDNNFTDFAAQPHGQYNEYNNGSYNNGHYQNEMAYQGSFDNYGMNENYSNYQQNTYNSDQAAAMSNYPPNTNTNFRNNPNRGYNNQNYY